jgi:hypothetical protein
VLLLPANIWPTRWTVVVEQRDGYVAWLRDNGDARGGEVGGGDTGNDDGGNDARGRGDTGAPSLTPTPRASQSSDLVSVLQDPIIRAFYFRLFRAPVINITAGNSQTTVVMREFADIEPPVPGRTLLIESDLSGRSRVYELKHFN